MTYRSLYTCLGAGAVSLLAGTAPALAVTPVLRAGTYYVSAAVQSASGQCPLIADAAYPGEFAYPGPGAAGAGITLRAVQAGATAADAHATIVEMALGTVPAGGWGAIVANGTVKVGDVTGTHSHAGMFAVTLANSADPYSVNGTFTLHLRLSATTACDMTVSYGAIITGRS